MASERGDRGRGAERARDLSGTAVQHAALDGTDIWLVSLRGDPREAARCRGILSAEEEKRASSFRFERDAVRYVIAHGALREILARYARQSPRELDFSAGAAGKPALEGIVPGVSFNLAHSGEFALVAVSASADVGIDIEEVKQSSDLRSVALRCFSPGEISRLTSVPPGEHAGLFFTYWTRKEAFVKGRGDGLSAPLTEIDVSAAPARPGGGWLVRDIAVPPSYKGAVATRGGSESCRTFRYLSR